MTEEPEDPIVIAFFIAQLTFSRGVALFHSSMSAGNLTNFESGFYRTKV